MPTGLVFIGGVLVVIVGLTSLIVVVLTLPAWGGDKEKDEATIKNATTVLQDMLRDMEF